MALLERTRSPAGGPGAYDGAAPNSVTLGLVFTPELPEKICREITPSLPALLSQQVDDSISWNVSVLCEPLVGGQQEASQILDMARERMLEKGWDLALCLTDLPVRRGGQLIVADASVGRGVAVVSLPVLGVARLRRRVREAILQLASELYVSPAHTQDREDSDDGANAGEEPHLPGPRPHRLVSGWFTELVAPIRRLQQTDNDMRSMEVDTRFVSPNFRGHLRLLAGMVYANRPWKILPSFKSVLAVAFATGAYVLIFPNLWQLADSFSLARLLAFMFVSISAMVGWFIIAHNLWEKPANRETRDLVILDNIVTTLTMIVAVLFFYTGLFALILLAASLFVPVDFFQSTLVRSIGFADYLVLAWLTSSLATVVGALGSVLEDEDTVHEAAYNHRQMHRTERSKDSYPQ